MNQPMFVRLGASLLKAGKGRIRYRGTTSEDWKRASEAVSREQVRALIQDKLLVRLPIQGVSRGRAKKNLLQRQKGKQRGPGTKSGSAKTYERRAKTYVTRIRAVRDELQKCRDEGILSQPEYRFHYRRLATTQYNTRAKVRLRVTEKHGT